MGLTVLVSARVLATVYASDSGPVHVHLPERLTLFTSIVALFDYELD